MSDSRSYSPYLHVSFILDDGSEIPFRLGVGSMVDVSDMRENLLELLQKGGLLAITLEDPKDPPATPAPTTMSVDYVAWVLTDGRPDHFTAELLRLIAKADPSNQLRLREGFPDEVDAYNRWGAAPFGKFVKERGHVG